jgi:hypothetical protein
MKTQITLPTLLLAVSTLFMTSCSNDEQPETNNLKVNNIELSEQMLQKEGDSIVIPNENEPIIVKPKR